MSRVPTSYDFDIATQTKNGKVDKTRLRQEVGNSALIHAKLRDLKIVDDNATVRLTFYDALDAGEQTALTGILAAHTGEPVPSDIVQLYKVQSDGVPLVTPEPRIGSEIVIGSHNFCDPTTWFGLSERAEGQALEAKSGSGGLIFKSVLSAHVFWIDMYTGRMHNQEHWAAKVDHGYDVQVYSNGTELVQCPPFMFTSGGASYDYWVDYEYGEVHFFEDRRGETITADFSFAVESSFVVAPLPGKTLRIEDAEADFSRDCVLNTSFGYIVYGYVDYFAPEYMRGSNELAPVLTSSLAEPPDTPTTGDRYLVGTPASGAWTGMDGAIVEWSGTGWDVTVPTEEDWTTVQDIGMYLTFRNSTWNPTPYPSQTKIPLQEDFYHRVGQIVTEARGALPAVNATGASPEQKQLDLHDFRLQSRGMKEDVQAIPFNYATSRNLQHSWGMELHVVTTENKSPDGETLTITFYCTSVDEE